MQDGRHAHYRTETYSTNRILLRVTFITAFHLTYNLIVQKKIHILKNKVPSLFNVHFKTELFIHLLLFITVNQFSWALISWENNEFQNSYIDIPWSLAVAEVASWQSGNAH